MQAMAARQMTPAAKSRDRHRRERRLERDNQLTRSVMTAKKPDRGHEAGTTPTQIALFFIAVTVLGSLKSFW